MCHPCNSSFFHAIHHTSMPANNLDSSLKSVCNMLLHRKRGDATGTFLSKCWRHCNQSWDLRLWCANNLWAKDVQHLPKSYMSYLHSNLGSGWVDLSAQCSCWGQWWEMQQVLWHCAESHTQGFLSLWLLSQWHCFGQQADCGTLQQHGPGWFFSSGLSVHGCWP